MSYEIFKNFEKDTFSKELFNLYSFLLKETRITKDKKLVSIYQFLKVILENSPFKDNLKLDARGLTMTELMKELNVSQHTSAETLQFLYGTTLICYKNNKQRTYWLATSRAIDFMLFIQTNNINMNEDIL